MHLARFPRVFLAHRWSGIEADVFSLGFGPVIVSRVDRRGTRWQFALIPFGGYVKFKSDLFSRFYAFLEL